MGRLVVIEVGVAAVIAVVVLVLQPGVAFGGILALLVLLVCGASVLLERRRAGAQPRVRRRL